MISNALEENNETAKMDFVWKEIHSQSDNIYVGKTMYFKHFVFFNPMEEKCCSLQPTNKM
jgi:hypothetical protein